MATPPTPLRDLVDTALADMKFDAEDNATVADVVTRLVEAEAAATLRHSLPNPEIMPADAAGRSRADPTRRKKRSP